MRIAYDAKRAFHNFTGLGNYARTLLTDLRLFQEENEYLLFTPQFKKNKELDRFLMQIDAEIISPSHPFNSIWRRFGMATTAKKYNIDIFHGLSHELPVGLGKKRIKSVVTMHDVIYQIYPEYYSRADRKIYHAKSKHACENADMIIAISASTKKDIIKTYQIDPDKIEVIHQSCSNRFRDFSYYKDESYDYKSKLNLPEKYMLYVGSIIERKKLFETVEAVKNQYNETGIPLVVVGQGRGYMKKVTNYVAENNLHEIILFRSNISNADLPYVYHGAEVFIYPSEYEGFGIPVIESIYCETPVISSNLSSLPEVGGEISFYLEEITAKEIEKTILLVLNSDTSTETRKRKYAEHLKNFHPDDICKKHQLLYEKCLS